MYTGLIEHILLPLIKRKYWHNYHELRRSCRLSPEEIKEIQSERLRALMKHACDNVPYYHQKFEERGLTPQDINSSEDLVKLPILTRNDVRVNLDNLVARNFPKEKLRPYSTGGSTGEPLQFYIPKDSSWGSAAAYRAYEWYGYRLGDKVAYLWGSPLDSTLQETIKSRLSNFIQRTIYLNAFDMSEDKMEAFARKLIKFRPKTIIAYAAVAYFFSRFIRDNAIQGIKPRVVITQAEKLFDYQREMIEQTFDCEVFDFYGSREVGSMAAECPQHRGYHISSENVVLEFVRDNGNPVSPGETGKILVTDLHNYAMPFIRYENGDLGVPTDGNCSCGINLPLMKSVEGRVADILVVDGKATTTLAIPHLFKDLPIKQYQVIQEVEGRILVKIIKGTGYSEENTEEIHKLLRKIVGDKVNIEVIFTDSIPPSVSGKHRFFISKVTQ